MENGFKVLAQNSIYCSTTAAALYRHVSLNEKFNKSLNFNFRQVSNKRGIWMWVNFLYILSVFALHVCVTWCSPNCLYLPQRYFVFSVWPNFVGLDLLLPCECWERKGGQRARCAISLYCTTLNCTVLHCIVLHCTASHFTTLNSTAQYCTALPCTSLHCTEPHCNTLYCKTRFCAVHHFTKLIWNFLHWPALHCRREINYAL